MATLLLDPALLPFTVALTLLFGLLALELMAVLFGGSLLGLDTDADLDIDLDVDFDVSPDIDLDAEFSASDFSNWEAELDAANDSGADATASTDWLGISKVPTLIWFAAALLAFGLTGLVIQTFADGIIGTLLTPWAVAIPAAAAGIWSAKNFAKVFARLIPKSESSAVSNRHLGRRRGIVSQGTAARGKPAEVRVMDGHGNAHYLRAEPLRNDATITQGTEVLVMRQSRDDGYRLVPLT
ncbi:MULTISPECIES: OB-fold-containig protein [Rhodobacterales]|uniref:OB-fold-containig protein n=1 Tax=Rhodobacterales TaxID=204455 RepID=UPI003299820B